MIEGRTNQDEIYTIPFVFLIEPLMDCSALNGDISRADLGALSVI